jgi:hypothetical protein
VPGETELPAVGFCDFTVPWLSLVAPEVVCVKVTPNPAARIFPSAVSSVCPTMLGTVTVVPPPPEGGVDAAVIVVEAFATGLDTE